MNIAPVISALQVNATNRRLIPLTSMFSVSDPDAAELNGLESNESEIIVSYRLQDQGTGGGRFVLVDANGAIQTNFPAGQTFTINANQVNSVFYLNPNLNQTFTETFSISAFDGIDESTLQTNTIFATPNTGVNTVPILRPTNAVVPSNGQIALEDLFTLTDQENNVNLITVRDNEAGGGFFTQNGRVLAPNVSHEIEFGDLDEVVYNGANTRSAELFSVQAFDTDSRSQLVTAAIQSGNTLPVIGTSANPRARINESIAVSELFTASDADGDTIERFLIADRNTTADSAFLSLDGVQQVAGQFFEVSAAQLSRLNFVGGSTSGTNTISIRAFDGTNFGNIQQLLVTTSAASIITDNSLSVFTGESIAASELFQVADADGDAPVRYFITDRSPNANSGFFVLDGQRLESARFARLNAAQFSRLQYIGGAVPGAEDIGVQVFDGFDLSAITNVSVATLARPTLTVTDSSLLPRRSVNLSSLVTFDDADGDPAVTYRIRDSLSSITSGFLELNGVQQPSGQFFEVTAAEFAQLEYVGATFGVTSEPIEISVSDGTAFSDEVTLNITTLENANAPVFSAVDITGRAGTQINARSLFNFTDVEGDTLTEVSFVDSSSAPNGNFFAIDGVEQASQQLFTVDFSLVQAGRVTYSFGTTQVAESFRVNGSDGRNVGLLASGTALGLELPQIVANNNFGNAISIDTIQRVNVSSLVTRVDNGVAPLDRYQILDPNTSITSGGFELDGNTLQQGIVHNLNAAQFDRLQFVGAAVDNGRQLDPVLIQGGNALGFSDYIRLNANTDQIGPAPTPSPFQYQPINGQVPGEPLQITYTFIDGAPQAGGTRAAPNGLLPTYYLNPGGLAAVQADGTRALNAVQRGEIRTVLDDVEGLINVEFIEVPYEPNVAAAQIAYGAYNFTGGGNVQLAANQGTNNGLGEARGDIFFNTNNFNPLTSTAVGNGSAFRLAAFQGIQQSLGVNLNASLSIFNNFNYNTITSGLSGGINDPFPARPGLPNSPQLYDVVALQGQYGVNPTFNAGNNQYFFNNLVLETLYDSGGVDTINFQNRRIGSTIGVFNDTIDLRQGQFSSINGVGNSLRITYGTVIENARGGDGNDTLIGNETANRLFGNGGADNITGGGGNDALAGGNGNDVYNWSLGDGRDIIIENATDGNGGTDVLVISDPINALSSLEDDITFRRFGNDLRIDLTFDQGPGQGTVVVRNFADQAQRVELLRLVDSSGTQIGNDISLNSIFTNATTVGQRFEVTADLPTSPEALPGRALSLASPI